MSIALLPEGVPCIDADPVSFLIGGVGVGRALDPARCMGLRLQLALETWPVVHLTLFRRGDVPALTQTNEHTML